MGPLTLGTVPGAVREGEWMVVVAEHTQARRGGKATDHANVLSPPWGCVLQLAAEFRPSGLGDAPD